jgi:hypothetical protein
VSALRRRHRIKHRWHCSGVAVIAEALRECGYPHWTFDVVTVELAKPECERSTGRRTSRWWLGSGVNDQALATLADFGDALTEAALITARLLAHAPVTVLFAQVPLVATLLHQAESLGKDSAELVLQALLTANGVITKWSATRQIRKRRNSNKLAGS